MAVRTSAVAVTTSAVALNTLAQDGDNISGAAGILYNDGAVTAYIGGADVTSSGATKGIPLAAGRDMSYQTTGEVFYGRTASGSTSILVMEVGVAAA